MARAPKVPRGHHYHVYVIELAPEVWDIARFRRANPDYVLGKPFVYVAFRNQMFNYRLRFNSQSSRFAPRCLSHSFRSR